MVADRNSAGRGEGGGGVAVCQRRGGGGREGEINNGEEGKGRKQRTRRGGGGSGRERERELSRIVRLWRDVQLVEDYYLSNRRFVGRGRKERRREGGWGGEGEGRGRHHVVNHGPVAPMYYIFPALGERRRGRERGLCTLRYCIVAHNVQSSLRRFLRL